MTMPHITFIPVVNEAADDEDEDADDEDEDDDAFVASLSPVSTIS